MGTRADFYVGTGITAEWLGSIAFDGYRIDEMKKSDASSSADCGACWAIKAATSENDYREAVTSLLKLNDDATLPRDGWPWPWETSRLTDYVYAFADGKTKTFTGDEKRMGPWPNMKDQQNVTLGPRSGVMVFRG